MALVESVGQTCRRGLVDYAQDLQAGELPGVLDGLPLGVVEVGWDGDDRLGNWSAEEGLGSALELPKNQCGKLHRGVVPPGHFDLDNLALVAGKLKWKVGELSGKIFDPLAHEALHRVDGGVHPGDASGPRLLANDGLAIIKADDRGDNLASVGPGDNARPATIHIGHKAVGGSQINADDATHSWSVPHGLRARTTGEGSRDVPDGRCEITTMMKKLS